jgi:hypothetical protein
MADFYTSIPGQLVKTINWFLTGGQYSQDDEYASEFNPLNPVREGFIDKPQVQTNTYFKPSVKDADMPIGSFGKALLLRPDYQMEYHARKMQNFLEPRHWTQTEEKLYGPLHQARELRFADGTYVTTRDPQHRRQATSFFQECERMKM